MIRSFTWNDDDVDGGSGWLGGGGIAVDDVQANHSSMSKRTLRSD